MTGGYFLSRGWVPLNPTKTFLRQKVIFRVCGTFTLNCHFGGFISKNCKKLTKTRIKFTKNQDLWPKT